MHFDHTTYLAFVQHTLASAEAIQDFDENCASAYSFPALC